MRLPDCTAGVLEWAYPGVSEVPCLRRAGAGRMLCLRPLNPMPHVGFVPVAQPVDPEPVCASCVRVLGRLLGWCPVCGAQLVAGPRGLTPPHDECVGVNLRLARGRR